MIILSLFAVAWADWRSYDAILQENVHGTWVDYESLRTTQSLSAELIWLAKSPIPKGRTAQMAFWINTYNLLTLKLVVDHPNIHSLKDLDNGEVWSSRSFKVANKMLTLDDIEHKILRSMNDPRIHAAINCASKSCPPLINRAYTEKNIDELLNTASNLWIESNALLISTSNIQLSPIFYWYSEDFSAYSVYSPKLPKKKQGPMGFILHFSSPEQQEILLLLLGKKPEISSFEYDWMLNDKD